MAEVAELPRVDDHWEQGSSRRALARPHPRSAPRESRPGWFRLRRLGAGPLFIASDALAVGLAAWFVEPTAQVLGLGATAMVLFAAAGLYRGRLKLSVLDDLPVLTSRFALAIVMTIAGAMLVSFFQTSPVAGTYEVVPLVQLVLVVPAVLLGAIVGLRIASYAVVRRLRARRHTAHHAIVVGTDDVARDVVSCLQHRPVYGVLPIGHLRTSAVVSEDLGVPVLGEASDLGQVLAHWDADVVIVSGLGSEAALVQTVRMAHRHHVEVFLVPRLHELHPVAGDVEEIWGTPLVRLRRAAYRTPGWRLKRAFDVAVSAFALGILAPLLGMIALAVRLDGGPGVIFRQQRVGVDGRHFELLKFRSMRPANEQESATTWSIAEDDRLSLIGRFIRRTSMDELPQLWNILRGDMSVVGPRPERPHFVAEFNRQYAHYGARHRVPCGLTGWSQVNGLRGDTSIEDRARFDNYYVENWSLWLDVKIVLRTFSAVIAARGA